MRFVYGYIVILGSSSILGCTLTGSVKTFSYGKHSYCMVFKGYKGQNAAMDECKKLNAQLPLPKSEGEGFHFRKITGKDKTWIGIRDMSKGGIKENWKDVEGNPIGSAYVNLRVNNFFRFLFCYC